MSKKDLLLENITGEQTFPICFDDLEQAVAHRLPKGVYGYIRSSAGGEETLRNNRNAFSQYSIIPRFLTLAQPSESNTQSSEIIALLQD